MEAFLNSFMESHPEDSELGTGGDSHKQRTKIKQLITLTNVPIMLLLRVRALAPSMPIFLAWKDGLTGSPIVYQWGLSSVVISSFSSCQGPRCLPRGCRQHRQRNPFSLRIVYRNWSRKSSPFLPWFFLVLAKSWRTFSKLVPALDQDSCSRG